MASVLMNYDINTNLQGVNGFARRPANANGNSVGIYNTQLAATTDKTVTVPSAVGIGQLATDDPWMLAIFNYQAAATVFVAVKTTANGVTTAAPDTSGTLTAGVSFINPSALLVRGGDIIHMYPAAEAFVSVEFYTVV
jgi:hypothetical protein